MILVDHQIRAAVENQAFSIDPFNPDRINPNSIDITLSDLFRYQRGFEKTPINPFLERDVTIGWKDHTGKITINPGQFILGSTAEKITLPNDLCAELNGKSSLARLGLDIHKTGGWIDAGFSGQITLELYNAGLRPIKLIPGMPIGQLVFHATEEAEKGYGDRTGSKYQDQAGPVGSRYYQNSQK